MLGLWPDFYHVRIQHYLKGCHKSFVMSASHQAWSLAFFHAQEDHENTMEKEWNDRMAVRTPLHATHLHFLTLMTCSSIHRILSNSVINKWFSPLWGHSRLLSYLEAWFFADMFIHQMTTNSCLGVITTLWMITVNGSSVLDTHLIIESHILFLLCFF